MIMPYIENGLVPHGKVILFITEQGGVMTLDAGAPYETPAGKVTAMVLGLNEEVALPDAERRTLKNMDGRAMFNGHVPAQLFPELG